MSFIFGLLAGAGEIVSGSAVEATGSALIGDIAGSTVAGTIGSQITNLADSAMSTVVDTIFGSNKYEDTKKTFYNNIDEAKAIGLFSGDVGSEKEVLQHIRDSNYTKNELINEIHNFAHDFSDEVVKKGESLATPIEENSGVGDILSKLSQENSVYYYLVSHFLNKDYVIEVPQNDPEYDAIATVYNGKNNGFYEQLAKTNYDGTNTIWSEIDETGQEYSWYYPLFNETYSSKPAFFGKYMGMSSPNDGTPIRGIFNGKVVESLADKSSFFHDIGYMIKGMFNKEEDYKLISRLSQNMDKMIFPGEIAAAKVGIAYFSNLGSIMRKMMSSTEPDPILKKLFKDVYNQDLTNEDLNVAINTKVNYGSNKNDNTQLVNLINNLEIEMD